MPLTMPANWIHGARDSQRTLRPACKCTRPASAHLRDKLIGKGLKHESL